MDNYITVTNSHLRRFNVRLLLPGDTYGLGGVNVASEPKVEFHDATYAGQDGFSRLGQFTGGRYYVETILGTEGGLDLHGGVPAWWIDSAGMAQVREWLRKETTPEAIADATGLPISDVQEMIR